jgi:hypothetical protein
VRERERERERELKKQGKTDKNKSICADEKEKNATCSARKSTSAVLEVE